MIRFYLYILFSLLSSFAFASFAKERTPDEVPNTHLSDRNVYVSDPDNIISSEAEHKINSTLRELTDSTSAEISVVLLSSIGDVPVEDFTQQLAEKWGIGKKDRDNGLLFLVVMDQHTARIHTGYGMEGVIPDITAKKILNSVLIPEMRNGNTDLAVIGTVNKIAKVVSDPAYAQELKSEMENDAVNPSLDPEVFLTMVRYFAAVVFLVAVAIFFSDMRATRRKRNNYDKSLVWKKHILLYIILTVLSVGTALLIAIPAVLIYRYWRTKRIKCDTCGAKMYRLGEEEDNELLTPAQDMEEKLNTVDYDVWECPGCGTIEKFPYHVRQSHYFPCPRCGTVAYGLKYDKILRQPTVSAPGIGAKVYECRHCGYNHSDNYKIPRKDSAAGAAALAGLAGMASGSRGGGGGFSGGSFGGGSFGGGGASGSW